jgi:hypothetical protein
VCPYRYWDSFLIAFTGFPAVAVWYLKFKVVTGLHEGIFGMAAAILALLIVSLLTQNSKVESDMIPLAEDY